jgi:hypothetical protein
MYDDDEILDAYEQELAAASRGAPALARRRHGFWYVVGAMTLGCMVLLGEIFANRSIGNDIGTSEHDLRVAQQAAQGVLARTDSFEAADAAGLHGAGGLTYTVAATASTGHGIVSVYAGDNVWAAAVQARPGACFYIRMDVGSKGTTYGGGTPCTAIAALSSATGSQW